jgi:hypothetical protein
LIERAEEDAGRIGPHRSLHRKPAGDVPYLASGREVTKGKRAQRPEVNSLNVRMQPIYHNSINF